MLTLGIRPSHDAEEGNLYFEILDGLTDEHAFGGVAGRNRVLGNLAERLKRKLGEEAFDDLHRALEQMPPDYFLALRAIECMPDELTFADDQKSAAESSFKCVEDVLAAAEIHYRERERAVKTSR